MSLFLPFRALGYITDEVPFAVQRRGKETFVTVSVGKAWQIYNASNLRLALVGPQLRHNISALATKRDLTFAAVRGSIVECKRVHRTGDYQGHTGDIIQLLVLGDLLFSLGRDGKLLVWRIGEYDAPEHVITLPQSFTPTCMAHPDTYLNKMIIGSEDGRMQLWNFSSQKCIHEFASVGASIRCITSSPALDVVGLGLSDGRAVLHNLRFDETVMQFTNAAGAGTNADNFISGSAAQAARLAAGGACTSLAFRTGAGVPLMAAGGAAGVITVWNLEEKKLLCTLRDAHDAGISHLHFFAGEPVLVSSGADNALKEWIFDGPDGAPRLLRFRSGHAAPPTAVRHYGDGKRLLSGGQDQAFRCFSTIQDAQSKELSQNHTQRRAKKLKISEQELKLGRITSLDACDVRERDWSNVITAHEGDTAAYVWRLQRYALGEHILTPPPKELLNEAPAAAVSVVCISRCGNFGFVGSSSGRLDRYNMQSGLHRGSYCRKRGLVGSGTTVHAHQGAILGLAADACNRHVISAGLDSTIRVWNFSGKRTLRGEIPTGSPVTKLAHHPGTALVAAACDDLVIRMYDVEALRPVRRFKGHTDRVTDMQLSEDCRWLLSAGMDNTLRVWDVPGARVLQVLRLGSPVTSLSLAPAMDLLATTHVEREGVYLWANQLVFGTGADIVPSETPIEARLPSIRTGFKAATAAAADFTENEQQQQSVGGRKRGRAATTAAGDLSKMLRHSTPRTAIIGSRFCGAAADDDDDDVSASEDEIFEEDGVAFSDDASSLSSDSDDDDDDDDNDDEVNKHRYRNGKGEDGGGVVVVGDDFTAGAAYSQHDAAGAPIPLAHDMVTMSLLPRTQWLNLVHLDTIQARNKPIEAPKKTASAPFYLPTLLSETNAGRNPLFDASAGLLDAGVDDSTSKAAAAAAAAAWGDGDEEEIGNYEENEEEEDGDELKNGGGGERISSSSSSRVLHGTVGAGATRSRFVELLHACSDAGDWTSLMSHLRQLSPSAVDRELRSLQLLEESTPEEERNVELLFNFLEAEAASNSNFEFTQALLRATLSVHAEAVVTRPAVAAAAARVEARVAATWKRLRDTLQHVRCMLGLLGSLQA